MDIKSIIALTVIFVFFVCVLRIFLSMAANKGAGFKKYFAIMRKERSDRRGRRKNKKR